MSRAIWHRLSIPFRTVVCFTEHLAILLGSCSTLAPCRDMIGIHLAELIDFSLRCLMTHCTVRAVGDASGLCIRCLTVIDAALYGIIEHTDIEQLCILFATEKVFKDSGIELIDSYGYGSPSISSNNQTQFRC